MKISGFLKHSLSDYPGCIAAVVFTQGCNFNCPFCHNRWLISMTTSGEPPYSSREIITELGARKKLLDGVVISGGEPTLQSGLEAFIREVRSMGYSIKLDTNGSRPEVIKKLIGQNLLDYIAMDIKAPFKKYNLLSGVTCQLENIVESIHLITLSKIKHHFRTTYFQKLLEERDLSEIKKLLPATSLHTVQSFKQN